MKKFNILYESVLKSLIKEGGNAVPGVDRIKKQYIQKTINNFKKNILNQYFGFDVSDIMFVLGSTGKKPDSGDIDLALDATKIKGTILYNLLKLNQKCATKGYVSCVNTINYKMIHVAYPQIGNQKKKVQIDLLLTQYPEFTKFFMWSPTKQQSKYKGAHRNQVLRSIAKITSYKPIQIDDNGNVVKWIQNDLTDDGYFATTKTLVDDEGNRLKYKSTDEDLEPQYALNEDQKEITHDVKTLIDILFGEGFNQSDIDTFEKCFQIVKDNENFKYKDLSNEILKQCADSLKNKQKRLDFPDELKNYL